MGRPSKIDQVVRHREVRDDDGIVLRTEPVTAGEQVIERVRATWAPWEDVAASAGISRQTLHSWRRRGGLARAKLAAGQKVTRDERRYVAFLDELERADAEAEMQRLGVITRAGQGGYTWTETKEEWATNDQGQTVLVRRTVTTKTAQPQWQASAWQLERRRPQKYALTQRFEHEHAGPGGGPIPVEERAAALADDARSFLEGAAAASALAAERVEPPSSDSQ